MKCIISVVIFAIMPILSLYAQSKTNLSFETRIKDWVIIDKNSSYDYIIDSIHKCDGNYSLRIIPHQKGEIVIGSLIDLKGISGHLKISYSLKTNSKNEISPILFFQISSNNIRYDSIPSKDNLGNWQINSMSTNVTESLSNVAIGIIYKGSEEIWIDDFKVTINDVNVDLVEPLHVKALNDNEYDLSSGIVNIKSSKQNIDKLYSLCKVWGLLKYYHPNIGSGRFNWDYELFRILPTILCEKTNFNDIISQWIGRIDEEGIDYMKMQDHSILNNDIFDWLTEEKYGKELYHRLVKIICSTQRKANYYVSFIGTTNPIFKNENDYKDINSNDCGYRLLVLFRAWNIIEYFFPYKYLTDKNWNNVLMEYIPLFIKAEDEFEYYKVLFMFSSEFCDSHTNIFGKDIPFYSNIGIDFTKGLPISVSMIEKKCVITNVNEAKNQDNKFRIGDIITHIDGMKINKLVERYAPYFSVSNNHNLYEKMYSYILSATPKEVVKITFIRDGKRKYINARCLSRYPANINQPTANKGFKNINDTIGYIDLGCFNAAKTDSVMNVFKNNKGIIFDLRTYPRNFIVYKLGEYLMPNSQKFIKPKQTSLNSPGIFNNQDYIIVGNNNPSYYKGKVVIIVNNNTISQGEFTAMALRMAPNAIIIGSQTAGSDGNVTSFPIPGGLNMTFTGLGIYYPDGGETQRIGVRIDEIIKPTIKGIREGRDEVLERAIEIINSK